ncbi:hypothetical protein SCHPADRAFT_947890 [Schizopora paradoxa]|uniref:Uncharacterized protein n=1 Tax=Schizopora paradoxa TaxID=27342 RepID=A0A0H2QXU7_9AGAM|nr:hypothetical protein SCHPADRAFT_947890 [Schizopora paradoxa]
MTWDKAKTLNNLERLDIQTHKDFYDQLFKAGEDNALMHLKEFGDELLEDYNVVITLLDLTDNTR